MALAHGAPSRNVQEECRSPDDTAPDDTASSGRGQCVDPPQHPHCAAVVRAARTGAVGLVAERLPWVTAGLDDL
jgi:hypothetical protein